MSIQAKNIPLETLEVEHNDKLVAFANKYKLPVNTRIEKSFEGGTLVIKVTFTDKRGTVCYVRGRLAKQYGCCGAVVLTGLTPCLNRNFEANTRHVQADLFALIVPIMETTAKWMGYSQIMTTQTSSITMAILKDLGYEDTHAWRNRRTSNVIHYLHKSIDALAARDNVVGNEGVVGNYELGEG